MCIVYYALNAEFVHDDSQAQVNCMSHLLMQPDDPELIVQMHVRT